ncbi:Transcriptional regulator, GntR family [Bifidobacterium lemurum]|uniref:Transcriptional regulator, GntR family n=2 Tax=Bifidobacterium lemurum TaxID=1603886 RepID=A0A261FSA0_9BIFI|nr:Transcriptional regulator, GntR family [Bifidobacterium lemurum]
MEANPTTAPASSHETPPQTELALMSRLATLTQQRPPMPANQRSRCDETMDAIRAFILQEHLQPGALLPTETMLCEKIGASRSSVREAVRKLEALNIVRVEHGKGTFVGSLSLDPMMETLTFRSLVSVGRNFSDLNDVVQMRRFLDMGCADEVVASLKGTEQPKLERLACEMSRMAAQGETFRHHDIDFHMGILDALDNSIAKQLVQGLWVVHMAVLPQLGLPVSQELDKTADAHIRMLHTAIDGDVEGYRQAVIDHYEPIESILKTELRK